MSTVIKVENLSKQYRLGKIGTGSIAHDVNKWWHTIRGKENPYLKIGEANDRSKKGSSEYVWSLKDVDFEIEQGDAVGIIGRNGAGKSTLLKILSRVTSPTTGSVKVKGRIASLLEVGTGFHPELSGRENIFLNGAILGMRKREVQKKFDEIVDFAGVERYIDTPVKRYSSGMYVRLAFAVAAHLESEILIVDEVLAVGDAEFQKKCLGKMNDVSKGEGRTVLFVSHNMTTIENLCNKGLLLKNGNLAFTGEIEPAINKYLSLSNTGTEANVLLKEKVLDEFNYVAFRDINVFNGIDSKSELFIGDSICFQFVFESLKEIVNPIIAIRVNDNMGNPLVSWRTNETTAQQIELTTGYSRVQLKIPSLNLLPGTYNLSVGIAHKNATLHFIDNAMSFELLGKDVYGTGKIPNSKKEIIYTHCDWQIG